MQLTPIRLAATAADLPPAVAAALADPPAGGRGELHVGRMTWPFTSWGDPRDEPLLLVHGVTSNGGIWWRVGPALAGSGRRVIAVDMPGHGRAPRSATWSTRFAATAGELVAFARAAGLARPDLAVVGHSWGGLVSAELPGAGLTPAKLILLDPPVLTHARMVALTEQPTERTYDSVDEAIVAVRSANPGWSDGDVMAKARSLTEFDPDLVLAILRGNGDWDGGMAALRHPSAAGASVWLIRGEFETGGFIPDSKVQAIERQLGADHVITIAGGPHSPQRTHPEATVLAILRALGADG